MRLSRELQISLSAALMEAAHRGHEYAGLEHLLYALLQDDLTARVLRRSGANLSSLQTRLERFLDDELDRMPEEERGEPSTTLAFQRVLARAVAQRQGAGKDEVGGPDVLVSMYAEPESFAVYFLEEEGITRLELVAYLAHGVSEGEPGDDGWEPDDLDDEDDVFDDEDDVRRGRRGRGRARSAGGVHPGPDRARPPRPGRSAGRPRPGDRAHPPHPGPAAQEQPDLRRRLGGRQDRPGRGAGAPDRRRPGARSAGRRLDLLARPGGAGRGDPLPGRLREPPQGRAQGAQGPGAGGALRRRDPHPGGGGSGRQRHHGRLEPAQAGAALGRAALHRRHHLGGVPPELRARPRPGAPVPEGGAQRAVGGGDGGDPPRPQESLRGAPRGHLHPPRGARGGRARGPAPARSGPAGQGDRPARRGRGGGTAGGAQAGRRAADRVGAGDHGPDPAAPGPGRRPGAARGYWAKTSNRPSSARTRRSTPWSARSRWRAPGWPARTVRSARSC